MPTRVYAAVDPDLHGVRIRHGDYVEGELAERMDRPKLVGDIITNWLKYGERRKTVAFAAPSVTRSTSATNSSLRRPRRACRRLDTDGRTRCHTSAARFRRNRDRQQLHGADRGLGMPTLGGLILARPTKRMGLYRQMIGRGLRRRRANPTAL